MTLKNKLKEIVESSGGKKRFLRDLAIAVPIATFIGLNLPAYYENSKTMDLLGKEKFKISYAESTNNIFNDSPAYKKASHLFEWADNSLYLYSHK